jgi:hypothetical protein
VIREPTNWLSRPWVIAGIGFGVGAVIAAIAVVIVLSMDGDDGNGGSVVVGTTTPARAPSGTPGTATATRPPGTPGAAPSATPGNPRDPDDALAAFVQRELGEAYIGPCPQEIGDELPQGICSVELYRSTDLVTFSLGHPFSEGIGEAVLTPDEQGNWQVHFVEISGAELRVGGQAVVLGAGDCLNFRDAPGTSSQVLSCQLDGTQAPVIGGPEQADGVTWWQLEGLGWASEQYLAGR